MSQKLYSLAIAFTFMAYFCQVQAQLSCDKVTGLNANEANISGHWYALNVIASADLKSSFANIPCTAVDISYQNANSLTATVIYLNTTNHKNVRFTANSTSSITSGTSGYKLSFIALDNSTITYEVKIVKVMTNLTLLCGFEHNNTNKTFGVVLSKNVGYNNTELTALQKNWTKDYTFAQNFSEVNQTTSLCVPSNKSSAYRTVPGIFGIMIFMYSLLQYLNN